MSSRAWSKHARLSQRSPNRAASTVCGETEGSGALSIKMFRLRWQAGTEHQQEHGLCPRCARGLRLVPVRAESGAL